MQWILLVLGCCMCTAIAAPLSYYNQRQNGDYNIQGRLQNFVVLIIPTSSFGLFDFAPSRQHYDTRGFYRNLGYHHQDNVQNGASRRDPVLEEKSFQVDEERLVDEPTEIHLDEGVKLYQDEEMPVEISVEQVKKAKVISTTLKKAGKEGVQSGFGGVKSVNTDQSVVVAPQIQEGRTNSVVGLSSTSGPRVVVEEEKAKSVVGLSSTSGRRVVAEVEKTKSMVGLPLSPRVVAEEKAKSVVGLPLSPRVVAEVEKTKNVVGLPLSLRVVAEEKAKSVVGLPSNKKVSMAEDSVMSEVAPKAQNAGRRLDVDAAPSDDSADSDEVETSLTSDGAAVSEKIKQLSAGIDICSPDQRRDDEGNCQTIKHKHSGQYFESGGVPGVNRVNPALSFGLSPANE